MTLFIRTHQIELSDDLKLQIEARVHAALGRFANRARRVWINVTDTNGPRGGIDKRCRIETHLRGVGRLIVEDNDTSILAVVGKTTDRLRRLVLRIVQRSRPWSGRRPAWN